MATQRQRGSFYEPDRVYTQDEFNALLRDLAAREDLARRDFSNLQTTLGHPVWYDGSQWVDATGRAA